MMTDKGATFRRTYSYNSKNEIGPHNSENDMAPDLAKVPKHISLTMLGPSLSIGSSVTDDECAETVLA